MLCLRPNANSKPFAQREQVHVDVGVRQRKRVCADRVTVALGECQITAYLVWTNTHRKSNPKGFWTVHVGTGSAKNFLLIPEAVAKLLVSRPFGDNFDMLLMRARPLVDRVCR